MPVAVRAESRIAFSLGLACFAALRPAVLVPAKLTRSNSINDALGGEYYAVARFETQFPIGLPEEYGIEFGAFFDAGSVWGLNSTHVGSGANQAPANTILS